MAWKIADWDDRYENNRSRELKRVNWFSMPNETDDEDFLALMSAGLFGVWVAILMIASRSPQRGYLLRHNGLPLSADMLAAKMRVPTAQVVACIELAMSIGAMTTTEGAGIPHSGATFPQATAGIPRDTPILLSSSLHSSPEGGSGGKPPEGEWNRHFTRVLWTAYPKHRRTAPRDFYSRAAPEALTRVQGGHEITPVAGKPHDDVLAWMLERIKAFAASPLGQCQYAPGIVAWLDKSRYLEEPECWERAPDTHTADPKTRQLSREELIARMKAGTP